MSTPEALPNNNASGVPKAHAANSRPEIELSLMTRIVAIVDKYSKPCQEEGEHVVDYDEMEEDLESLIAQEADKAYERGVDDTIKKYVKGDYTAGLDKLANKRVYDELRAVLEVEPGIFMQDTMLNVQAYINGRLSELDKGDNHV